jgi:tetratricopeptide (TPR) repeat protein
MWQPDFRFRRYRIVGNGEKGLSEVSTLSAENSFRRGLAALVDGEPQTAASHFQSAIKVERQQMVARPQMRYLSYYGLSLAMSGGAAAQAIKACEAATRSDPYNPDLLLNLGRVYLIAGRITRAMATFEAGLRMSPGHRGLRSEHAKVDRREPPPLTAVPRGHALNKWLGRLRATWRPRTTKWSGAMRQANSS